MLTMGISTVVIGLLPGYATIGIFARCCWRWLDLVRVWA
ncbi:MHS family MFS transporter [Escherichia coli]|nr:MHS family MFS transporter [Escherichia coli]